MICRMGIRQIRCVTGIRAPAGCEGLRSRGQGERSCCGLLSPGPMSNAPGSPAGHFVARCRAPRLLTLLISRPGRESSGAIEASRSRLLRSRFVMESCKVYVSSEQNAAATLQVCPMSACLGCCRFFVFAFGIATSILDAASIHPERSGGLDCRQHAGLYVEPSRASKPSVAGKGKTPPGSCSVAPSDRSQCDSTGPAAVWADDQAVTRALLARKSPRQT